MEDEWHLANPYTETDESLQRLAEEFLARQSWCRKAIRCLPQLRVEGFFNLYWADFEPSGEAPSPVWIIVGDVFPAFMFDHLDGLKERRLKHSTPSGQWIEVLEVYVSNLEDWADAVESGETDMSDHMPLMYQNGTRELPATKEIADIVRSKINAFRGWVLPRLAEEGAV